MNLKDILDHPKHLEFFKKYGYVKYSGASMGRLNVYPKVTLMLPIDLTREDLYAKFCEWKETL